MVNKPEGIEQRITRRLISYWHECKGTKNIPLRQDISKEKLEDVWQDCFLIEVTEDERLGHDFRYTYIGPRIIAAYGDNVTGADIQTSLLSPDGSHITDIFEEVVETKKPVVDESEFRNLQKVLVRYRQCVLPFGDEKGKVTCLLGGMRWGAF
jgi:hypothetical protein